MELKPITSEEEYDAVLIEIEKLWDSPAGTPESDKLDVLVDLVVAYDELHYPIKGIDKKKVSKK